MSDPLLEQLLAGFVDEAEEIASRLTLNLLELERRGGGRSFDDLARGLHTLKGSAATIGLDSLSELAHRMEDALLPLRSRPGPLPGPIADAVLRALDTFLAQLRHLAGKSPEPRDLGPALALLEQAVKALGAEERAPAQVAPEALKTMPGHARDFDLTRSLPPRDLTPPPIHLRDGDRTPPPIGGPQRSEPPRPRPEPAITPAPPAFQTAKGEPPHRPQIAPDALRTQRGEPGGSAPPGQRTETSSGSAPQTQRPETFGGAPQAQRWEAFAGPPESPRSEPPGMQSTPSRPPPRAEPRPLEPEPPKATEDSWRVNAQQVVSLLQEAERLREVRLRIDERRREVERAISLLSKLSMRAETVEARSLLATTQRALTADSEEAADVLAQLEEGLKIITTLPVRTVLEPLRRALRDISRAQGKEARLSVVGAEVSLDRRVLDALRGPLVHLIRNAIDHGLEPPHERELAGKHREGAITIRVEQQGNMLFLEVSDDGRGLDVEAIRAAAYGRGVASEAELALLNESQLQQLIFRPNLTTRHEVTELSGRGVGLDVARAQLLALRGQIEVHSVRGQGTRFSLTVPADLGSSPVLVVRVGEHLFGVPMAAIESSRRAHGTELRVARGRMQLTHREQMMPLHDLGAMLGLRQAAAPAEGTPLLILLRHGTRLAIAIDEVVGDMELLIRPLPPEMRDLAAWQGAATLARGELILVLRADWLVQAVTEEPRAEAEAKRALVVDDSLTARALHRTALEAGGWHVHTASSGEQALEQLKHAAYDVVVADIGMAPMDGLELTRAIRAGSPSSEVPIILVSAHDGPEDRARGQEAGADGFLSKRDCASGRLLAEVQAVVARKAGAA